MNSLNEIAINNEKNTSDLENNLFNIINNIYDTNYINGLKYLNLGLIKLNSIILYNFFQEVNNILLSSNVNINIILGLYNSHKFIILNIQKNLTKYTKDNNENIKIINYITKNDSLFNLLKDIFHIYNNIISKCIKRNIKNIYIKYNTNNIFNIDLYLNECVISIQDIINNSLKNNKIKIMEIFADNFTTYYIKYLILYFNNKINKDNNIINQIKKDKIIITEFLQNNNVSKNNIYYYIIKIDTLYEALNDRILNSLLAKIITINYYINKKNNIKIIVK